MSDGLFPDAGALCEGCGYSLRGLGAAGACPECGLAVDASHPRHRVGPPWQVAMGAGAGLVTVLALVTRPGHLFRTMRVDGSNRRPRLFLGGFAVLAGLAWAAAERWVIRSSPGFAVSAGLAAAAAVVVLAYVEAFGVAFFSRRRGWSVPLAVAERIVCYASPGLLLAALLLMKLRVALVVWAMPMPTWLAATPGGAEIPLLSLAFAMTVLGFEVLVYTAVRRVRFANRPIAGC